jgi:hypothetical protein
MTNHASDSSPDRFHQLMTGALDGELSPLEQEEFERMLAGSVERQREWSEQKKLKELTMQMRFNDPPEEVWDHYWTSVYGRLERRVAWVLVSIGGMVVLFYGMFKATESIWADPQLPRLVKGAILALMAGGIILFVSVLREKLFTRKGDKYREIQR